MAIDLDVVAAEIGKRHGIKISKDDPMMIVVTMLALLEQEALQQKQNLMASVVSEVEVFMTRNNQYIETVAKEMLSEAAGQAQAIINKTLAESKEALQSVVAQSVKNQTANIHLQLEPSIKQTKQAATMSLIAACGAFLASGIALWASL